jgi:hypothetical protein
MERIRYLAQPHSPAAGAVISPNYNFQRDRQMNKFHRLAVFGVLTALVSISGCVVAPGPSDHGPYRYENGDRIDRNGNRDANWCGNHSDDQGCRR